MILEKLVGDSNTMKKRIKLSGYHYPPFRWLGECLLLTGRPYFPPEKNLKIPPETPL